MSESNLQVSQSEGAGAHSAGPGIFSFLVESGDVQSSDNYLVEPPPDHKNAPDLICGAGRGAAGPPSCRKSASSVRLRIRSRAVPRTIRGGKRGIDILLSFTAIMILAPVMVAIATVLILRGGPILFAQERVGLGGRPFTCYKFRTMKVGADGMLSALLSADPGSRAEWEASQKMAEDPRITRFGRFLRASSLDELPQLICVLKGDMSLVGPRPILRSEMARYQGYLGYYLAIKPGLTGLWQVSGRNETTYRRRVSLDVAYVRNISIGFDAVILAKTIPAILWARGAS